MPRRVALIVTLLVASSPLLGGCGAIFGQRYQNFTAYYNTFYNAQRAFDREERTILRADTPVDRGQYLSLLPRPASGTRSSPGLEAAIRKAADLLRDHPDSRWVDDALLLIGKAYFYQGNFGAAAQKFREVLAFDGTPLTDEAALWLGRSLMEAGAYAEAADALRAGLDRPGTREEWAAQMRFTLGEIDVRRGDLEAADAALQAGLRAARDRELAARAAFLLGQVRETMGDYAGAAEAFGRVIDRAPRSGELVYAAELQRALSFTRHGRTDAALNLLQRLRRDDKYFQQRAEIELQRARVLAASERPEEARDLLLMLLYDRESGLRTDGLRDRLHYRLAEVYREGLGDYTRAAAHFDTAAVAMRRATVQNPLATREAVTDVEPLAQVFGSFARVQERLTELDSLLYLGGLGEEEFTATIAEIQAQRDREAAARAREMRRMQDQQGFAAGAGGTPIAGLGGEANDAPQQAEGAEAAGFLGYRDPVRVQENLVAFQMRWGRRPLVPNWRRAEAVSAAQTVRQGVDEDQATASSGPSLDLTRGLPVDVSAIPRTPEALRRMREERASVRYELGNVLFLGLDEPASAMDWYRRVLEEDGEFPVALRATYALAEAERALGRSSQAEVLYTDLAEQYPDHPLGIAARERLGLPVSERTPDELARAEADYGLAYQRWQEGDPAAALRDLLALAERYEGEEVAARARLAAGLAYAEWAAGNPSALLAPTPEPLLATLPVPAGLSQGGELIGQPADPEPWLIRLYAGLEADYPDSRYAQRARVLREALTEEQVALSTDQPPLGDLAEAQLPPADAPSPADMPEVADMPEAPVAEEVEAPVAEAEAAEPVAETPLRGGAVDPARGGYAWVVASEPSRAEAERVAEAYRAGGYRVSVLPAAVRGGTAYRVAVGQFASAAEAARYRRGLPADAPPDTWLLTFPAAPAVRDEVPAREPEQPVAEAVETPLRGGAVHPERGGYTWVVASEPTRAEAEQVAAGYRDRGFRVSVLPSTVRGRTTFRVAVGQFTTEAEAVRNRRGLPPDAPADTWLLTLTDEIARQSEIFPEDVAAEAATPEVPVAEGEETEPPAEPEERVAASEVQEAEADAPEAPVAEAGETEPLVEPEVEEAPVAEAEAAEPVAETPLRGGAVDPARGGYAWVVASEPSRAEAERVAEAYRAGGYRVSVLPAAVRGGTAYRVAVGQFASAAEAAHYRRGLPLNAPTDTWLLRF